MHRLAILGICATLSGCTTQSAVKSELRDTATSHVANQDLDTLPCRWEDYSNRVWIAVSGVGVEVGRSNILQEIHFSYSPNTGRSSDQAIAIWSFNMITGRRAEQFLLRVLYGTGDSTVSRSNLISDGKAFHIYTFKNPAGDATNTVYFDGTKYHNLF